MSGRSATTDATTDAILATTLRPDHPDYRLYQQIHAGVERIDAERGRSYDGVSERLTLFALARHKESGGGPIDHVAMAKDGATLFLVSGRLDDPAQHRTAIGVAEALNTAPAESLRRAEATQPREPSAEAIQERSQE